MRHYKTKTNVSLALIETKKEETYVKTTLTSLVKGLEARVEPKRDLSLTEFVEMRNKGIKVKADRVDFYTIEAIQKALVQKKIACLDYTKMRMEQRGYTVQDIASCIWTGVVTEIQNHTINFRALIEGFDSFNNPMCVVVTTENFVSYTNAQYAITMDEAKEDAEKFIMKYGLNIISVFPPIRDKFARKIV